MCQPVTEDRKKFFSACSELDEDTIVEFVDGRGIDVENALDDIGQNCLHFVVCGINDRDHPKMMSIHI